jgi:hypothetical protein
MENLKEKFAIVDGPTALELAFALLDCPATGPRELRLSLRPLRDGLIHSAEPYCATIYNVYREDEPNAFKVFGSLLPHTGAKSFEATHVWQADYNTERREGFMTASLASR